jgi:catalase
MQRSIRHPACIAAAAAIAAAVLFGPPTRAEDVDPAALVDALQARAGTHRGFRRAHAKGVCAEGRFQANGAGRAVSKATLFAAGPPLPVVARFSIAGGDPGASDKRRELRSLALAIPLANGEEFRAAMNHAPVFSVNRPEHFLGLQLSRVPDPATGLPDPAKVKAFDDAHPDTRPLRDWLAQRPLPIGFRQAAFFSAHAFKLTAANGSVRHAKWEFLPDAGVVGISPEDLARRSDDFLFADLRADVARAPLRWRMVLVIGEAGDPLTDPTLLWPENRRRLTVGALTIDRVDAGTGGACRDITFDPLLLPAGIDPTDDPVLLARSAPYAVSLARRLEEAGRQ